MKDTHNHVVIRGDPRRIFDLAAAVEDWPDWLPHYRWVRVLAEEGPRRTVEMAATRTGWPVRWISYQWRDGDRLRIRFRHIGGLSRGMDVEWRIEPAPASEAVSPVSARVEPEEDTRGSPSALPVVHVSIWHDLRLELPLLRSAAGRWVVGELFVKAIASRTLACLKARVERETAESR